LERGVNSHVSQMSLSRIIFDTSALSALAKDAAVTEPYIRALNCGFDLLLTAMSVDELIAAPIAHTREAQFACCQQLLVSGTCVWPPHEIITRLVRAHANDGPWFDWRRVNIRAREYERAIIDRDFDDGLSVEQLDSQRLLEQEFMTYWESLRPKLAPILDRDPSKRPTSYIQAIKIARSAEPNLILGVGKGLYGRATGITLTDAEMEAFLDACPPFRAACYGFCGAWYDVAVAPAVFKRLAGRNDQMMSIYLPYCNRFVTRDKKQLERLRDVAVAPRVDCDVASYEAFCAGFEVVV
jgi:hypothetical protein